MKARIAGKGYVLNAELGFLQVEALFPLYDNGQINHIEVTTIAVHNGKRLDYNALAELLGVTRFTIYRDIADLH